jgi:hypothetical protein
MVAQKVKKGNEPKKPENRNPIPLSIWGYDFVE